MRVKIALALLVPVLVVLNYGIYEKEQIKKHGETLLLELAPVDPRSLMQGDYMRLRYALERKVPPEELVSQPSHGFAVILPDENNVARFVRFHKEEDLKPGEKLLRFHKGQYGEMRIVPDSFLFQEGHAKRYENAKYGVFKFDDSGDRLLVGLADEKRKTIRVEETENDQE